MGGANCSPLTAGIHHPGASAFTASPPQLHRINRGGGPHLRLRAYAHRASESGRRSGSSSGHSSRPSKISRLLKTLPTWDGKPGALVTGESDGANPKGVELLNIAVVAGAELVRAAAGLCLRLSPDPPSRNC